MKRSQDCDTAGHCFTVCDQGDVVHFNEKLEQHPRERRCDSEPPQLLKPCSGDCILRKKASSDAGDKPIESADTRLSAHHSWSTTLLVPGDHTQDAVFMSHRTQK